MFLPSVPVNCVLGDPQYINVLAEFVLYYKGSILHRVVQELDNNGTEARFGFHLSSDIVYTINGPGRLHATAYRRERGWTPYVSVSALYETGGRRVELLNHNTPITSNQAIMQAFDQARLPRYDVNQTFLGSADLFEAVIGRLVSELHSFATELFETPRLPRA